MLTRALDLTDVPIVSARELGLALKMLRVAGGARYASQLVPDHAFRQTDAAYWQTVTRDNNRKSAVLVRLRAFVEVCGRKRIQALLAEYGDAGLTAALEAAAALRLNAEFGFNPMKMAWAMTARGFAPVSVSTRAA